MNFPLSLSSCFFAILTVATALSGASAGTLTNSIWKADACGDEPVAPVLHTESSSAYKESIQWVQLYQQRINTYNACVVKEANADVAAINTAVRASQHRANDAFDQYNAASKQMSGQSSDESGTPRHNHRGQQGGFSIGSGGD